METPEMYGPCDELQLLREFREAVTQMVVASTMLWHSPWGAQHPSTVAIRVEVPIPPWDEVMDALYGNLGRHDVDCPHHTADEQTRPA